MPTKKVNRQTSFFFFATVPQTCLCERLWTEKTKGKGNKCVRNGKTRGEKQRQQMNKSMSKRTYRGNACMWKVISWIFCDTKGRGNCVKKKLVIKKMKGQTQKEMKKWGESETNKNKKWRKKDGRNVSKEKHKKMSKEIHLKNTEEFFFRERDTKR